MNVLPIALTTLVLGSVAYLGAAFEPSAPASAAPQAHQDCKPGAPVQLEITDRQVRGDRVTLRYRIRTELDVESVWVEAEADTGCSVSDHSAVNAARLDAGGQRSGKLELRLAASDARAIVRVHYSFMGADNVGNQALETLEVTHLETFGELRNADEVTEVVTDGEVSLSMPARHL